MTDLIGPIGAAISIAKDLLEINREYEKAVVTKQMTDLIVQLSIAQTVEAERLAEIRNLKAKNRRLKAELEQQVKNPLRYTGVIYRDKKKTPFCPACYDNRKKRIHLTPSLMMNWSFSCPVCDKNFDDIH